jgi:epsin
MRDRMLGNIADSGLRGEDDFGGRSPGREQSNTNNGTGTRRRGDEDDEIKRAIQASMDTNADDERRRNQRQQEDDELSRAIRASEDAEAKRKREQEEANQKALFDDSNNMPSNNMYAQQPLVDLSPQPIQPQFTSYNVGCVMPGLVTGLDLN